jgi:hypothetical protein
MKMIEENGVKFIDFRFTDTKGKEQHVSVPAHTVEEADFEDGKMFDGSSIAGWKGINESDMILMPDASTAVMDPFFADPTLILRCDIIEPATMQGYSRDPRSIAKRAEESPTPPSSARNPSSSSSTTCAGVPPCRAPSTPSTPRSPAGTPRRSTRAATSVTARA